MATRETPSMEQLVIYQALLNAGKPTMLNELFQYLIETYPAIQWDRKVIVETLENDNRIRLLTNGGRLLYSLKEFRKEPRKELEIKKEPEIKKEKVHLLVYEFIKAHDGPVHISEIEKYISNYHEIDQSTLKLIIKVDLKNKCLPLGGGYYECWTRQTTFEKRSRR